jgi:hypothetical protein
MSKQAVATQPVTIPGPAGDLEALVDVPRGWPSAVAVTCHPHPLQQGTMHNKVAYTLSRTFVRIGAVGLRFNFRGVGRSAGRYDDGEGEVADAVAAVDWALQRWPAGGVYFGGFSFGAVVALRAAHLRRARGLVTIAPPVRRMPAEFHHPECPWLLLQGTEDDVVLPGDVRRWADRIVPPPDVRMIDGAGHFFHGRLAAIAASVTDFFAADAAGPDEGGN